MKNQVWIELGLEALARAGGIGWFHGHYGAAVLAGERLLRRPDFSPGVKDGIADQMERARRAHPALFRTGDTSPILPDYEAEIVEAIRPHVKALHLSGHGVIYGALALQALRENPAMATRSRVDGIVSLIGKALGDKKHRYYGVANYETFAPGDTDAIAPYHTIPDMAKAAFAETAELYPDGQLGEHFYFFTSEKLHGITFAHALHTLHALGFPQLARDGLVTHRKALLLNRQRPPKGKPVDRQPHPAETPYHEGYWQLDHFDDHRLKLAVAALELLETLPAESRHSLYDPERFWFPFRR